MRYCPTCGAAVSDTARYCPECGTRLPERSEPTPVPVYEQREDPYNENLYDEDPYDEEVYEQDDYESAAHRRSRREEEEDERYYRESRKTMIVGIIMAVLICVVGVGLYIVVSDMLKKQPEVEVGSGLGDKPVQVDTTTTEEKNPAVQNPENQNPETGNKEEAEPETAETEQTQIRASVVQEGQTDLYGYQVCGVGYCQVSSVLEDGGVYHVAEHMIDGDPLTSWQEASDGDGIGDWAYFRLDRAYSVRALTFKMGNWRSESLFYANNRPERIRLKLDEKEIELAFPDGMQAYTVELAEECQVSEIEVQILSVHRGEQWDDCCISEMTVYGR